MYANAKLTREDFDRVHREVIEVIESYMHRGDIVENEVVVIDSLSAVRLDLEDDASLECESCNKDASQCDTCSKNPNPIDLFDCYSCVDCGTCTWDSGVRLEDGSTICHDCKAMKGS
jgi:methionyl-tRNA synthetase